MDTEDFPQSDVAESGDLELDKDFIALETAIYRYDAEGAGPLRKGEEGFHWGAVESSSRILLLKAKDLRVAIWYLRACLARRGLPGVVDGAKELADIMALPPHMVYPRPSAGESDREAHSLHLGWICGQQFLHQLGRAKVSASGEITLNDIVSGDGPSTLLDEHSAHAIVKDIRDATESFERIERSATEDGANPEFDISRVLELMRQALSRLQPSSGSAEPLAECVPSNEDGARWNGVGVPRSRHDVSAALDQIIEYFRLHEPSHPAPIFLLRTKRMLGVDFGGLMAELYSESGSLVARLDGPQSFS